MALTDLVPWSRSRSVAAPRSADEGDPFLALHREMNRMFDDFARGFGIGMPARFGVGGNWPTVEVSETENEVKVVAELPGMEQKDIEVSLADGVLTLKGEKKSETNGALYSERWHGRFQRALQVGPEVDPDKVSASFKNGVLTVTMPKHAEAQSRVKRIPISNG
ncbi:MAG TPA: Hsp20/alpha crystallin family protein [Acetobacteraceae bacterium]|nr:Hsp20/alpha crystallin family protein [Acetobacteraceae bacterium]